MPASELVLGELRDTSRNRGGRQHEERAERSAPPSETESDSAPPPEGAAPGWDPLALLAPGEVQHVSSEASPAPASISNAVALAEVVRGIAWGGDRRRGTARLELGGRFAGAVVLVDASGDTLNVELQSAPGVDGAELAERLRERLVERGLRLEGLVVR